MAYAQGREVQTIFIGGGTPSLLSGPAMQTLLDGVRARLPLTKRMQKLLWKRACFGDNPLSIIRNVLA